MLINQSKINQAIAVGLPETSNSNKKELLALDKNIFPDIRRDDVVYTYKERAFTGFAPCFQNGVYSLACCKGAKNGKGMRQSVCRTVDEGKTVWILAIAAGDINRKDCDQEYGDFVCRMIKLQKELYKDLGTYESPRKIDSFLLSYDRMRK